MFEFLSHRQMLGQPFTQVPFADQRSKVAGITQCFGDRPLFGFESVNSPRRFSTFVMSQRQAKLGEVARLAEIFRTPVAPGSEGISFRKECRASRSAHACLLYTSDAADED